MTAWCRRWSWYLLTTISLCSNWYWHMTETRVSVIRLVVLKLSATKPQALRTQQLLCFSYALFFWWKGLRFTHVNHSVHWGRAIWHLSYCSVKNIYSFQADGSCVFQIFNVIYSLTVFAVFIALVLLHMWKIQSWF